MASLRSTAFSLQSKALPSSSHFARISSVTPLSLSFTGLNRRQGRGGDALVARMSVGAATSYASALADVAQSNNTLEATCADLEKIEQVFSDQAVFDFFANPIIDEEKKQEVAEEIVKSSKLLPHTSNFLKVLIDANRTEMLKDIVEEFEAQYNQLTDTELAVVTSVVKLESEHLAQIAKQVQKLSGAKNVRIKTVIDPSLVAGFTVSFGEAGSKIIDMSVKKQLEEIAGALELEDLELVGSV